MDDLSREGVTRKVIRKWESASDGGVIRVYALHVGGLNYRHDDEFVSAMNAADVIYADGGSVVALARLTGATAIQRAPTTDIGWDVLRTLGDRLGRPARIALIGGAPGLAERAGHVLQSGRAGEPVFVEHGYHSDWDGLLYRLAQARPDVCIIGMGAPLEMLWVERWAHRLPATIVLTCGGWFGHLVGDEERAPAILRRSGLEWIARIAQAPRRLGPRYLRGIWSTAVLAIWVLVERIKRR